MSWRRSPSRPPASSPSPPLLDPPPPAQLDDLQDRYVKIVTYVILYAHIYITKKSYWLIWTLLSTASSSSNCCLMGNIIKIESDLLWPRLWIPQIKTFPNVSPCVLIYLHLFGIFCHYQVSKNLLALGLGPANWTGLKMTTLWNCSLGNDNCNCAVISNYIFVHQWWSWYTFWWGYGVMGKRHG